jgi:flagellin
MAINDIQLTAGMRQNLASLQNTVSLLNRTEQRLASGNKVNSAIDDPTSYFTAQALNTRASLIDSLKNGMGQAIETVQAANKGITAITSLIAQAKGIAQAAQSAPASTGFSTVSVAMATAVAGDTLTLTDGTNTATLTAGPTAAAVTNYNSFTMTLDGAANIAAGNKVTVNGVDFTATVPSTSVGSVSVAIGNSGITAGETITVGTHTLTATASATPGAGEFTVTGNKANDTTSLMNAINGIEAGAYSASSVSGTVTISAGTSPLAAGTVSTGAVYADMAATNNIVTAPLTSTQFAFTANGISDATNLRAKLSSYFGSAYTFGGAGTNQITVAANSSALTSTTVVQDNTSIATAASTSSTPGVLATNEFQATGNNTVDAINLANLINNVTSTSNGGFSAALVALHNEGYTAVASNGVVTLSKALGTTAAGNVTEASNVTASSATMTRADVAASSQLSALQDQYNSMLTQLTALATDSGYQGLNLLNTDNLTVQFESTSMTVNGFNASASGLGITNATWANGGSIAGDITKLDAASTTLSNDASALSGNLSVITVRQDFSTNMINTLTDGSNQLVQADTNEEGANMLMLQTRQSLGTTALSLSSQAAQSVLRLFQ